MRDGTRTRERWDSSRIGVALALLLATTFACSPAAEARPAYGALAQLPGRDGCTGLLDSCRPGTLGGQKIVLSPDERFAYVASDSGTVAAYLRNRESGALRRLPGAGGCVVGHAIFVGEPAAAVCVEWDLLGPAAGRAEVAVAPEGRHLYFASGGLTINDAPRPRRPAALVTLERDEATGRLRPAGCIAGGVGACAPVRGMRSVTGLAVSPDGRSVYVSSSVEVGKDGGSSVAVFARDLASGALTQLPGPAGCVAPEAYSGCLSARGLRDGTASVVISPDGKHVYVISEDYYPTARGGNTITAFTRDPITGSLTQLPEESGCLTIDGRACGSPRPRGSSPRRLPEELVFSPDGRNVYVPFVVGSWGGVVVLSRDPATGELVQLRGKEGCLSLRRMAGCRRARALEFPTDAAVSTDGRNVYVSAANSKAIAVFARRPGGALRQLPGRAGCVGGNEPAWELLAPQLGLVPAGCAPAAELGAVSLSRDGSYAYAPSGGALFDGPSTGEIIVLARNGPRIRLRVSPRGCARSGLRVSVSVWTQGKLRRATVRLDGRILRNATRPRFSFRIAKARLASRRRHRLSILAADSRGRRNLHATRIACPSR